MPVTAPVELTVATDVALLVHTPPVAVLESGTDNVVHTSELPLIVPADGVSVLTVNTEVAATVAQLLTTV